MDWYSIVKLLHIVCAIVWVGGGFTLVLLGVLAELSGDVQGKLQALRASGELGGKLFAPMSMLTLVFGLTMCAFWVGFSDLWILIGLAGYATTFCIGMFVFKPTGERIGKTIAEHGVTAEVLADGQRILRVARFDYAVMIVVVADMVLKPTAQDIAVLACMALIIAAGAVLALGGSRSLATAQA